MHNEDTMAKVTQYSAIHLFSEAGVDPVRWNREPSEEEIADTTKALEAHNIRVIRVRDGAEALSWIRELIPRGSEVMNGSSTTLVEIGFEEYQQSGDSGWKDLHLVVNAENDASKRADIRRRTVTAEYFLSGVNAIARSGELVGCDKTGSRVGAWPIAAKNLIFVAGVNKIVPTVTDALERVRNFAYPLENARAQKAYGIPSSIGKCVILANEPVPGRVTLILINEHLGY
jgi:hypothetical protein